MMQATFEYIGHGNTRWQTTSQTDGAGILLQGSTIRWDELLWKRHELSGIIEVAPGVYATASGVVLQLDGTLLVVLKREDSRVLRETEALLQAGWKQIPQWDYLDTHEKCDRCEEEARFCPGHNP